MMLAARAPAGDATQVSWHSDVDTAWKATREQGRPLLVFVTRDECFYCTQMKEKTYNHALVAAAIHGSFVPLVLDGRGSSQLLKELRVAAYPCTFVISPQAVILDRIDGYVAPEAFANRLHSARPAVGMAKASKGW
jgi:protein disulfide-isomerase